MGELLDYLKDRHFSNNKSVTQDMMEKTKVKNALLGVCDEYLESVGDVLTIEVSNKALSHMVTVVEEEPLKSKYAFSQISPTMFNATLREIEL